jgi:hypothetical protein
MALSVLEDGDKGRFIIDRHKYDARQEPVPASNIDFSRAWCA